MSVIDIEHRVSFVYTVLNMVTEAVDFTCVSKLQESSHVQLQSVHVILATPYEACVLV